MSRWKTVSPPKSGDSFKKDVNGILDNVIRDMTAEYYIDARWSRKLLNSDREIPIVANDDLVF
ncbi:MAG: hypothetical protein LQ337_005898 [Flavoplaca oasis]|nr:MAG: hypothetical protein LQ337_005898 [Flavoplaca oasis]